MPIAILASHNPGDAALRNRWGGDRATATGAQRGLCPQPRTLHPRQTNAPAPANRGLDQPPNPSQRDREKSTLNSHPTCLKLVDTIHMDAPFYFGPPLCTCDHLGGFMRGELLLYAVPLAVEYDHGFSFRSLSAKKIKQSRHLCFRGRSLLTVVKLLDPHSGQCLLISVNHLRTSTFVCLLV